MYATSCVGLPCHADMRFACVVGSCSRRSCTVHPNMLHLPAQRCSAINPTIKKDVEKVVDMVKVSELGKKVRLGAYHMKRVGHVAAGHDAGI